jgi:hypothetical protein
VQITLADDPDALLKPNVHQTTAAEVVRTNVKGICIVSRKKDPTRITSTLNPPSDISCIPFRLQVGSRDQATRLRWRDPLYIPSSSYGLLYQRPTPLTGKRNRKDPPALVKHRGRSGGQSVRRSADGMADRIRRPASVIMQPMREMP